MLLLIVLEIFCIFDLYMHIKQSQFLRPFIDKLSQAMAKWGLPSEEGEIKKQLQILSERYTDNTPEKAYGKILAFSRLAEFAGEQHRHNFQLDIVGEYNNQIQLTVNDIFSRILLFLMIL